MVYQLLRNFGIASSFGVTALFSTALMADPQYAISMYGTPALPQDFVSLPYANPDAPTGGTIKMGAVGTFD